MKIRNGFVSNSSSASFIISKKDLTENQIDELLKYTDNEKNYDGWTIEEESNSIAGFTIMDNETINSFFNSLNIPDNHIEWRDY